MTDYWDTAEPNTPSDYVLGTAIQVWSYQEYETRVESRAAEGLSAAPPTVGEAAKAFHVSPSRAARAIVNHPWMYLAPPDCDTLQEDDLRTWSDETLATLAIQHDGE